MDSSWLDTSLDLSINTNSFHLCEADRVSRKKPPSLLRNSLVTSHEEFSGCHVLNSFPQKIRDSSGQGEGDTLISLRNEQLVKQEASEVSMEEISRIMSENKRLTEMLKAMFKHCNTLQNQMDDLKNREITASRKRKHEDEDHLFNNDPSGTYNLKTTESSSSDELANSPNQRKIESCKLKISRVYVQSDASDISLVVKDGYHWRKYGQKVTRDNPSPRAYYKCSLAPNCQVKKRVQRSVENPSVLVATYEGEHNHEPISRVEIPLAASRSPSSSSPSSCVSLDLVKTEEQHRPELQQFLVQQMASSLTRDPNFTAALAAAFKGRVL